MTNRQLVKNKIRKIVENVLSESSSSYPSKTGEFEIGDIVGNTVQGFDFKVLNIQGDTVTVKNTITNQTGKYYIHNFYKPKNS